MNLFAIPPIIVDLLVFLLGIFVLFKNYKAKLNIAFSFLCLSVVVWLSFFSLMYLANDPKLALSFARIGFWGIFFIPVALYHFIVRFLNINSKYVLKFLYLLSIPSLLLSFTDYVYRDVKLYRWGFYPVAGAFYWFFIVMIISVFSVGLHLLFRELLNKDLAVIKRQQIKWVFFAFCCGLIGLADYFAKYPKLHIYPFGYFWGILFVGSMGYTIIRYRLMDIKVVLSRTIIFILLSFPLLVFPLILSIIFRNELLEVFGDLYWIIPLVVEVALSFVCISVYLFVNKKVEQVLLKKEYKERSTYTQIADQFINCKDKESLYTCLFDNLEKLSITDLVVLYVHDKEKDLFVPVHKECCIKSEFDPVEWEQPIIKYLQETKKNLFCEDILGKDSELYSLFMNSNIMLVLPIFRNSKLKAFMLLGQRNDGNVYSDLIVKGLSSMLNQFGLAIDYLKTIEEMKSLEKKMNEVERLALFGNLVAGLAHNLKTPIMSSAGSVSIVNELLDKKDLKDQKSDINRLTENH